MRIMHVRKTSGLGGAERHLIDLARSLGERGVSVGAVIYATGRADRVIGPLRDAGCEVTAVPWRSHVDPLAVAATARAIRAFRPDVVHTHQIHGDIHGGLAARFTSTPFVATMHNARSFYEGALVRSACRMVMSRSERTITISQHVADYLTALHVVDEDKVALIPYGLDPDAWRPTGRDAERRRLDFDDHDVVITAASRLIPGKGHAELIAAFGSAARRLDGLHLLVAGDGPLRDDLVAAVPDEMAGRVRFLGHVDDMRGVLAASDIFAMVTRPELSEGFGLAALEAMAIGLPVIASHVGSLPEVVADGVTGLLVDPTDPCEIGSALLELTADPGTRARMGAEGRARAVGCFSIDQMTDQTVAVYERAA